MSYMSDPDHSVNTPETGVSIANMLGIGGIQLAAPSPPAGSGRAAGTAHPPAGYDSGAGQTAATTEMAPTSERARIGHNSGAQPMLEEDDRVARKKAYYVEVLTDWFANRRERTAEHMTPKEIGDCENRPALLLHAMVIGIASIYREVLFNPESTESPEERVRGAIFMMGVYVADVYFSHNDKGCSTASAERVAELLGCSKNSVKRARVHLVQHQILAGGRKGGHGDRYWPAISRKVASDPKASVVWLLDATSEPIKRGRPVEIRTPDAGSSLDEEISPPAAGSRFPEPEKSSTPSPKSSTPDLKSSTRMRGRETLDIRQDSLSGADAPGACAADLFASGVSPDGAAKPKRKSHVPKATEDQFARFWAAYPIKEGTSAARRNFLRLTHDEAELAIFGAAGYAAKIAKDRERLARRGDEPRIKWAQGWLTERRFEDFAEAHAATAGAASDDPEVELKRFIASPDGQAVIREHGPEGGMRILRKIVTGQKDTH